MQGSVHVTQTGQIGGSVMVELRSKRTLSQDTSFRPDYKNTTESVCIDGKTVHSRSGLEVDHAFFLQRLKEAGLIQDWWFETMNFHFPVYRSPFTYLVDFTVKEKDGRTVYHETKGKLDWNQVKKFQRVAEFYPEARIIMIMSQVRNRDIKKIMNVQKYIEDVMTVKKYRSEMIHGKS